MSKRFLVWISVSLFFLVSLVSGFAEEKKMANLLIIIDSSNSMSQLTKDRKERLAVVKTALNKLVVGISGNINLGMMVFGGKGKGKYGYKNVEMVIPIGPLDATIVKQELDSLQPKGVSPVAVSLRKAAQCLANLKGRSCILLMSDGKDTCGGDPVKTAAWIREKYGISVVIDVVGLNVAEGAQQQLSAVAAAGGGRYHTVNTSGEMSAAFTNVIGERIGVQIEAKEIGRAEKEKLEQRGRLERR